MVMETKVCFFRADGGDSNQAIESSAFTLFVSQGQMYGDDEPVTAERRETQ